MRTSPSTTRLISGVGGQNDSRTHPSEGREGVSFHQVAVLLCTHQAWWVATTGTPGVSRTRSKRPATEVSNTGNLAASKCVSLSLGGFGSC